MIRFDILYIGNDTKVLDALKHFSDEYDLSILVVKHLKFLKDNNSDLSFTYVLTEQHIDYNYEGLTVDKLGLNYSFIGILTDDIADQSILIPQLIDDKLTKYLVKKDFKAIDSFIKSNYVPQAPTKVAIEA